MEKILILSEDESASSFLGMVLQKEHFFPILANRREAALQSVYIMEPEVLMIDLPVTGTGAAELCMEFEVCHGNKAIIILGDSSDEIDKVLALEAGADDYVTKPFAPRELVARVRALLRRRRAHQSTLIHFGNVEVDRARRSVMCRGQEVKMTPCEYKLLLFFLTNVDLALTRQTLLQSVWGYSEDASSRTLDAHVSRLRNKFELDPATPRHFMTIHGVGYRFVV
jgi:DNA-binding response OmpR family regulator